MRKEKFFLLISPFLFSLLLAVSLQADTRQKGSSTSSCLPSFAQIAPLRSERASQARLLLLENWITPLAQYACHLLFLNTIVYYFTSLSPGDGDDPPFHERKEKAFPDYCVVMSQETVSAAHCVTSPNPTKFHFSLLQKLLCPVLRRLGNRHCPGDGRACLFGPQGALLRQGNLSFTPARFALLCSALPGWLSRAEIRGRIPQSPAHEGAHAAAAQSEATALPQQGHGRSSSPQTLAFNFTRPKTSASVTSARRCS